MPARKPPTATACQILLDGLAHGVALVEILNRLAPLHPRNNTFPGEVLIRVAADALDWAGVDRARPIDLSGMGERFLPECIVTGRDKRKLQFAILVAAAQHGGVEVDLLDEVTWWQTDDFWRYAAHAAVAYIRMAADRAAVPEPEVCRGIVRNNPRSLDELLPAPRIAIRHGGSGAGVVRRLAAPTRGRALPSLTFAKHDSADERTCLKQPTQHM